MGFKKFVFLYDLEKLKEEITKNGRGNLFRKFLNSEDDLSSEIFLSKKWIKNRYPHSHRKTNHES